MIVNVNPRVRCARASRYVRLQGVGRAFGQAGARSVCQCWAGQPSGWRSDRRGLFVGGASVRCGGFDKCTPDPRQLSAGGRPCARRRPDGKGGALPSSRPMWRFRWMRAEPHTTVRRSLPPCPDPAGLQPGGGAVPSLMGPSELRHFAAPHPANRLGDWTPAAPYARADACPSPPPARSSSC